jgi:hypothetical protein
LRVVVEVLVVLVAVVAQVDIEHPLEHQAAALLLNLLCLWLLRPLTRLPLVAEVQGMPEAVKGLMGLILFFLLLHQVAVAVLVGFKLVGDLLLQAPHKRVVLEEAVYEPLVAS